VTPRHRLHIKFLSFRCFGWLVDRLIHKNLCVVIILSRRVQSILVGPSFNILRAIFILGCRTARIEVGSLVHDQSLFVFIDVISVGWHHDLLRHFDMEVRIVLNVVHCCHATRCQHLRIHAVLGSRTKTWATV
jgi:hypothetical protein